MSKINSDYVPQSFFKTDAPATLAVDQKLAEQVQAGVSARLDRLPPAGDDYLKQQIRNLAPGDVNTAEKLTAVLDRFEAAANKLDKPSGGTEMVFTGDIAKFLARAMIEFASQQRQQAADDRLMARESAKNELLNQAKETKSSAEKMMAGAITNLVIGVTSSAVQLGGSIKSLKGQVSEIKNMSKAAQASSQAAGAMDNLSEQASLRKSAKVDVDVDVKVKVSAPQSKELAPKLEMAGDGSIAKTGVGSSSGASGKSVLADSDAAVSKGNRARSNAVVDRPDSGIGSTDNALGKAKLAKSDADAAFTMAEKRAQAAMTMGQVWDTAATLGKSAGGGVDASLQASAKYDEAEGQVNAAQSQYYQQIADGKKDIQDSMKEMVSQIINFIKEMRDAEVDAMRSLTKV